MLEERRRTAFPLNFLIKAGIVWAFVSVLMIVANWSAITTLHMGDPDDVLRLIQVRDLLAGQSWFDVTQYRVDAPGGGVAMHWSRLVDVPLAIIILALSPIFGTAMAETIALVAVPLITMGCVMLLASRIAWRLWGDEEAIFTALIIVVSIPVLFQLSPLRIDHHGWQLVCALAAMNGLLARSPSRGGWIIGGALAFWLAISIEGLPLAAITFAVLGLRWLRDPASKDWAINAIQSLAVVSALLFLATRGIGDLASYCDAISPMHLAMFAWGVVVLTLLGRASKPSLGLTLTGFAVAGGGALTILFAQAPVCVTGGGFAQVDPLVAETWLTNVKEGRPLWEQALAIALQYLAAPLIGIYAAIQLARRFHDGLKPFWTDYALILGGALLVSIFVSRTGAVACVLASPLIGWQVRRWLKAIRKMNSPLPRMAAMIGVAFALLPAIPALILTSAMPLRASVGGAEDEPVRVADCRVQDTREALAKLPKGEIYAMMDIAPELLLVSDHTVLATGHHRGDAAMKVLIETALGTPDQARETLNERGTGYVAVCPALNEPRTYAQMAPDGFVAQLASGDAPQWLEPVAMPEDAGLKLWRVMPE
ncbi:hypothetical protein INR77_02100 [Erythrobacter sp. SCSIO 43205]|uniref:hypothetical protein n=1 Tax=Erythrobacter sp. SCSIO 43205 TaxID=2779361 RepID=UPI001CA92625|nr:hypothetical protein [Erythrobacter sp. SCSIO 43205]UAB78550.1 hypothetical protein INR77_02100 [Erythrobacter sp. SCSIO 43205]